MRAWVCVYGCARAGVRVRVSLHHCASVCVSVRRCAALCIWVRLRVPLCVTVRAPRLSVRLCDSGSCDVRPKRPFRCTDVRMKKKKSARRRRRT